MSSIPSFPSHPLSQVVFGAKTPSMLQALCDEMDQNLKDSFSKYKHGIAYVSNVDSRGIFSVNGIFKRQWKPSLKPRHAFYDFVNILCYVGGEIRDGFLVERLKESELTPILEAHFLMAKGKAILQPTAVEDAAKLLILPCHEKAKSIGIHGFPNGEVRRSFEFYERVSRFSSYGDEGDFIKAKRKNEIKKTFSHLDLRRPEFDAWWIEKSELQSLGCDLPPPPASFPESGKLLAGGDTMIDFISESNRKVLKMSAWKKKTLENFSVPSNFEKLSGMCRHQALWYIWKGDFKMGMTMLEAAKNIRDAQNGGKLLSVRNPVVDLILNMTQMKLARRGEYEGHTKKIDLRLSREKNCSTCLAPAKKKTGTDSSGAWTLTCVDLNGKGKIGTEATRRALATALVITKKIRSTGGFRSAIKYSLKDSLDTFLEHSFVNLCWNNKPTPPLKEALIDDAAPKFVDEINCENFDPGTWTESCAKILQDLMVKYCQTKMSHKDITKIGELFKEAFTSEVVHDIERIEDEPEYTDMCEDKDALDQFSSVMTAVSVAPTIANRFLLKWKTMSHSEKKKTVSASFNDLLSAARKVYECCAKGVPACLKQKTNATQGCKDKCDCQDMAKFQDHIRELLTSSNNPVSFLRAAPDGTVTLNEGLFEDDSGELVDDMISCRDMYVYEEIMDANNWKEFAWCPRLAGLTKFTLGEVYTQLKVKIVESFKEKTEQEQHWLEMHSCAYCGQTSFERNALKKCSACKAVVYCNSECQKKHWKAVHKQKCQILGQA